MKALDELIRRLAPGGIIVVKAQMLGLGEKAFHRLALEIQQDGGFDDCDFVKAHHLGESSWGQLGGEPEELERLIDAITLRRHKR